jgi:nucleoside phosphorylase
MPSPGEPCTGSPFWGDPATVAAMILVVAATERELAAATGAATLACGIGPIDAAASTARALAQGQRPDALLHVGIAGARRIPVPQVVIGSEAVYEDALAAGLVPARMHPDPRLVDAAQRALPDARVLPIGTSARVGGTSNCEVEAMEGFAVLRAAKLAGVPAVEVRAVSNEIDEPDRQRWRFDDALAALDAALPKLLSALDG